MGQNPQQEDKTNIFRSQENTAPQTGTQPLAGGSNIKSSIEGAISSQAPSSGSGSQQALQRSSLVAPKSDVIKANIGKTKAPRAAGEAISSIKEAGEGLQKEADAYLAGAEKTKAPDFAQISSAIQGDLGAQRAVTDVLGRTIEAPSESFNPNQDIQIEKAAELSTPAGIQRTLQREGDEEYTKGMGSFDLGLLGQSPEFAQTMEAIGRGQKSLYDEADKAKREATAQRLRDEQASLKEAQEGIRGTLADESKKIIEAAKGKESSFDNQIAYYKGTYTPTPEEKAAWDKEKNDYIQANAKQIRDETANIYGGYDYSGYLTPEQFDQVDAGQYISYNPEETDYTQFLDTDQANQFNTIMSMLGDKQGVARGNAPVSKFSINKEAYQKGLIDKAKGSYEQEKAVQEWKKAGGLEPAAAQKEYIPPEVLPTPNVESFAIPPTTTTDNLGALRNPVNNVSYDTAQFDNNNPFPNIGAIMIPQISDNNYIQAPPPKAVKKPSYKTQSRYQ